jgi:hypothetical protein
MEPKLICDGQGIACDVFRRSFIKDYTLHLSDLFNEPERTFSITGFIENSKVDINVGYYARKLTGKDTCVNVVDRISDFQATQTAHKSDINKLVENSYLHSSIVTNNDKAVPAERIVIKRFRNSIKVDTRKIVGGIKILHSTYGSAPCKVFTSVGNSTVFSTKVTPYLWSMSKTIKIPRGSKYMIIKTSCDHNYPVMSGIEYKTRK